MVYSATQLIKTLDEAARSTGPEGHGVVQIFFAPHGSPQALQASVARIMQPTSGFLRACPLTPAEMRRLETSAKAVCEAVKPNGVPVGQLAACCRAAFEELQTLATDFQSQQKLRWIAAAAQRAKVCRG